MPGSLIDTNVWIAAVFPPHPRHAKAREALKEADASRPAFFCRSTQQSFLRIVSTPVILRAYGADAMTNRDALAALEAMLALSQVRELDEPSGTVGLWHRLAARDTASPKIWMDAYLAAFAIAGGLRLTTLDRDFKAYEKEGLELRLLGG